MLDQDPEEPLDGPEERPVDHLRPLPGPVGGGVLDTEPDRLLEVHLQGRQLPAQAIASLTCTSILGVERALALGDHVRQAGLVSACCRAASATSHSAISPTNFSGLVDSSASNSVSP